jgi:hypothetical protein
MAFLRWLGWGLLTVGILAGCNRSSDTTQGTGAKERAQAYFEALIYRDWPQAYSVLDATSQKRCSVESFCRLAESYCIGLGFEPEMVQIRACEERGQDATAHVVLTGRNATKDYRYKDAVALRRGDDGWRVVLSSTFGQTKKR